MTLNQVIERVSRMRPGAADDLTQAAWLIELEGKLRGEVLGEAPDIPEVASFPEDGGKTLCAPHPYDNIYELYVLAMSDHLNRDFESLSVSAEMFNAAEEEFRRAYRRSHGANSRARLRGAL